MEVDDMEGGGSEVKPTLPMPSVTNAPAPPSPDITEAVPSSAMETPGGGGRGRGSRKRGAGKGKRGGGRGKKVTSDPVQQIEQNIKSMQVSTSGDNESRSLFGEDKAEVCSIFMPKQEVEYPPGCIPGLESVFDNKDHPSSNPIADVIAAVAMAGGGTPSSLGMKSEVPESEDDNTKVRRSSRIKSLEKRGGRRREVVSSLNTPSLSSSKSLPNISSFTDDDSNSNSNSTPRDDGNNVMATTTSVPNLDLSSAKADDGGNVKHFKVKSRWRYSSDAESFKSSSMETLSIDGNETPSHSTIPMPVSDIGNDFVPSKDLIKKSGHLLYQKHDQELLDKLRKFQGIEDSIFRTARKISKESKGLVCDCYLAPEDIERGENGCVEDCLNRLLMVECGPRCPTEESCMNKRFQRKQYATLEVFKTEKKGHGLRTLHAVPEGGFVIEYVGEVLDPFQFDSRAKEYAKGNSEHFYFMALKSDAIIDATFKGNCSRFINHSCEPNCETQKWTVNGELRIGFFTLKDLKPGDEIVFDYQFQRYGKKAQACYCGTPTCRGWIGGDEEEEDLDYIVDDEGQEIVDLEGEKKKKQRTQRKPGVPRRKRKDIQKIILEDVALNEELSQLEASGLKNKVHTLGLSRLMVRGEKWDDRCRILNILRKADQPCLRLFLDYRGLKLMYNWMIELPLPSTEVEKQVIKDEAWHLLCLEALELISMPNKNFLIDSKVLSLMETWAKAPSRTLSEYVKPEVKVESDSTATDPAPDLSEQRDDNINVKQEGLEANMLEDISIPVLSPKFSPKEGVDIEMENLEKLPKSEPEILLPALETPELIKIEPLPPSSPAPAKPVYVTWTFVEKAKALLESWAELREVFRIPKKERVEEMKAHEREADKGSAIITLSSSDRDGYRGGPTAWKNKRERGERRHPTLDTYPNLDCFNERYGPADPNMSKAEKRQRFAQLAAQETEHRKQRRMQDDMIVMHQHRCQALGLDPSVTPVVDISGHYYLDPNTIQWKTIHPDDPSLPPGIKRMLDACEAAKENHRPPPQPVVEEEPAFAPTPWPEGLPPPPPLPPKVLPDGWGMSVDEEGRCYYYHLRTKQTQWHPPTAADCQQVYADSSDSSDSETVDDESDQTDEPECIQPTERIPSIRKRIAERSKRRIMSGLVQERIISPRTDDDKSDISKAVIRARKLEVQQEKRERLAAEAAGMIILSDSEAEMDSTEVVSAPATSDTEVIPINNPSETAIINEDDEDDDFNSSRNQTSEEEEHMSSPIETELDISLASIKDDGLDDGFTFTASTSSSLQPSKPPVSIPGLDGILPPSSRSGSSIVVLRKDRTSKLDRKQKSMAYKKLASDKSKEAFRNQIANVVVTHLNPYRKPDCKTGKITSTEDFKHLARKMTHAILLKELKNAKEGKPLEVTDRVKQKTMEYVKKFMARFGTSNYLRSPETGQKT